MASPGERDVAQHPDCSCLKLFRRRRLLAFLRLNNLSATFDSLNNETPAFFDVRFLQRLVAGGRWDEAKGYISRFMPSLDQMGVEARTAMRFIALLNILDDLAHGNPAGAQEVQFLERLLDAHPSAMDADPHCREIIRTIFYVDSHPELRDTLDWGIVRHRAGEMVRDLIRQAPELSHLLRLPRWPINPYCTIPFGPGLGPRRRHHAKNIGRMPATLLARRFRPKERRSPSARDLGLLRNPMAWVEMMIDEALVDGEKEKVEDHSLKYSCGERITGAPVAPSPGEKHGITSSNSGTKRVSQQDCDSGSVSDAKRPRTTGEFCQVASLRFQLPEMKSVPCKAPESHVESPVVMKTK